MALALRLTPIIYSLGPALLAEVVPPPQRGAMLAINNSIASKAGIAAPIATGGLIQDVPGARGHEIGFGGRLMLVGLLGCWPIDPAHSVQSLRDRFCARSYLHETSPRRAG
jgi:MFS family permease